MSESKIKLGSSAFLKFSDGAILTTKTIDFLLKDSIVELEVKVIGHTIEDVDNYYYVMTSSSAQLYLHFIDKIVANALLKNNPHATWLGNPSDYIGLYGKWLAFEELFDVKELERNYNLDFCKCKVCKTSIQYAEPNQPDNTFICFSCKENPIRAYY